MMRALWCVVWVPLLFPLAAQEEEILSLKELREFAEVYAPSLSKQRLTYSNLVESVTIAKAKYDPNFQVRRGWEETDDPERTTGTIRQTLPADLDVRLTARNENRSGGSYTNYALNLSKTLLGGGTFLESRLPVERAWIQEAQEANTLSLEARRLRLTVARRYYAVVRNLLTLRLRELQLDRARRNLEHAIAKEDPLDIATAELRIPESELDVISTRQSIESSTLELAETIGLPVDQPLAVSTNLAYTVRPFHRGADIEYALENHERILNARLSLELNQMEAKVSRSQTWPELRMEATFEEEEGEGAGEGEARAEIVLEWPWLDRADRAEAEQRRNDVRRAELELFEATQAVRKDIENTAAQLVEAERAVELREERLKVLRRQFLLYEDRWENGEINILEYVRSQNDLENARVQLVTQQARYLELRAEYDFLTGR